MSSASHYHGNKGTRLRVTTNSFTITRLPIKEYTQYDVLFNPEVNIPHKRQQLIQKLQNDIVPEIFSPRAVYDGRSIMFSSHPLKLSAGGGGTFTVNLGASSRSAVEIRITQSSGSTVKPSDLNPLIQGGKSTPQTATATNLLQLLIRQAPNLIYPNNGRSYFTSADRKAIGGGLELWRGYFQSVRPTLGKMLVNIDISMSTMYESGNLIDVCFSVLGARDVRSLALSERQPDFKKLEKHLKQLLIHITVPSANKNRTKTIRGLVPNAGNYVFQKDGKDVTIQQHYHQAYNTRINHPSAIGVRISPKSAPFPVIVPAELCTIISGQRYKKKIPENLQSSGAVVKFATMRPAERLRAIERGVTGQGDQLTAPVLQYQESDYVRDSGMVIDTKAVTIDGRVLETPKMRYGSGQLQPRLGSWNVVGQKLVQPVTSINWGLVNFEASLPIQIGQQFMETLMNCCHKLGMEISRPSYMGTGIASAVEEALELAYNKAMQEIHSQNGNVKHFLLVVILPQNAVDIRSKVKLWGDVTRGITTQCVRENKLWASRDRKYKANDQYCNNVAIKINARLGGNNSIAGTAVMDKLRQSPYMVMGADVGHPGPGIKDRPSVTSLVFSHDRDVTRYAAFSRLQSPRHEIIADLKEMVRDAVDAFGKKNRCGPQRIIFFRDGVSEGEYKKVAEQEIEAIKAGIDEAWARGRVTTPKPKLTFIVVGKRHHIRFFPAKHDEDKSGNCPPGFVADIGLSSPTSFDFYLQSHGGLLGTSRPSHYIVLEDQNFEREVDTLQELAFALCHVYAKATRSVSIPAPVYYADLVCSRANFYFDAALRFADDTTTASGSESGKFDLDAWTQGYKTINPAMDKSMYFL